MVAELAIPEEPRQHCQGARRESLIDEWFLPFESLDCRTAGQRVFTGCRVGNLRIEFRDRSQPFSLPPIPAVERLAQNELPARCTVAKIEPVCDVARLLTHASVDDSPHRPCVHTPDQALRKTFELVATKGPAQEDLDALFTALDPDSNSSLDGVRDIPNQPLEDEPQRVKDDLHALSANHR